jgi:hypothetical protein
MCSLHLCIPNTSVTDKFQENNNVIKLADNFKYDASQRVAA